MFFFKPKTIIKEYKCPQCGMKAKPTAKFCIRCGISLRELPEFAEAAKEQTNQALQADRQKLMSTLDALVKNTGDSQVAGHIMTTRTNLWKIYDRLNKVPDKYPDIKSVIIDTTMDTAEVISSFNGIDAEVVSGFADTREEIVDWLEKYNEALENIYEQLFEDDTIDIDINIELMKNKIYREGIAESDFDIE